MKTNDQLLRAAQDIERERLHLLRTGVFRLPTEQERKEAEKRAAADRKNAFREQRR